MMLIPPSGASEWGYNDIYIGSVCMRETKKYGAGQITAGIYILALSFILALTLLLAIIIFATGEINIEGIEPILIILLLTALSLSVLPPVWILLFDLPSFRVSASEEGITMYMHGKKYPIRWDEVVSWDIHGVVGNLAGSPFGIYYMYFSKKRIFLKDRKKIVRMAKKDKGSIVVFQCTPEIYADMRPLMPAEMRLAFDPRFEIYD